MIKSSALEEVAAKKALQDSGKSIPLQVVTVSIHGDKIM